MRLRHKKNAETEILNCPIVINSTNIDTNKLEILTDKLGNRTGELCEPNAVFNNNNPIHLELGMGKGRFITELSKINPDINYIGIERSATIVLKAIDLLAKESTRTSELCNPNLIALYPNLRFMCIDIANLTDIFAVHSIDKIYLNFSDPWPKKRHEIRRLTHHNFLSLYEKVLKPGSFLEFKTDNKDLFDFSLEEIKSSNFKLLECTYDLHNDAKMNEGNIMTEYEEMFSKIGNKICKLIAKSTD